MDLPYVSKEEKEVLLVRLSASPMFLRGIQALVVEFWSTMSAEAAISKAANALFRSPRWTDDRRRGVLGRDEFAAKVVAQKSFCTAINKLRKKPLPEAYLARQLEKPSSETDPPVERWWNRD